MKRVLSFILALTLISFFIACGEPEDTQATACDKTPLPKWEEMTAAAPRTEIKRESAQAVLRLYESA